LKAGRTLRNLHAAAIHAAETQPDTLTHPDAVHGLGQQMIHALVMCLSDGAAGEAPLARQRHQELVVRFVDLLGVQPDRMPRIEAISAALGISGRSLSTACREQLGMPPAAYLRLHRMHLVHRALRRPESQPIGVSTLAQRHGFRELGRFAGTYRTLFGELPSATLRQDPQSRNPHSR
jgi:AraC-like DNA-binding protein